MQPSQKKSREYYEQRARELRAEATANAARAVGAWLRKRLARDPKGHGQTA